MSPNPQFPVDLVIFTEEIFKGALSGLRKFLTTESPLDMIKKAFYFTWKALKSWIFGHVKKLLD